MPFPVEVGFEVSVRVDPQVKEHSYSSYLALANGRHFRSWGRSIPGAVVAVSSYALIALRVNPPSIPPSPSIPYCTR